MAALKKIFFWIADLRIAIILLLVIAIASSIGTTIPQGEAVDIYLDQYNQNPYLGFINGQALLFLGLNHIYTCSWFLILLTWLGLALISCTIRRQLPSLKAGLKWIDYKEPRQLSKLAIAETIPFSSIQIEIDSFANLLRKNGWQVQSKHNRFAARKGLIGRIGPPLVHIGFICLMIGAAWGALAGSKLEKFLTPGNSLELFNQNGNKQYIINLKKFKIDRSPAGEPEQFRSTLEIFEDEENSGRTYNLSVNHPLRFKGITIYQADWSLAAITLQIDQSPQLQLPLTRFPTLGENIWGVVLPTNPDGSEPVLLSTSKESGPVQVFNEEGDLLTSLRPGSSAFKFKGISLKAIDILPSSGLLLKHDPGVPLVYTGFAITLIGGLISMISTKKLWAIKDRDSIHIAGICNRNLEGLANDLPQLINSASTESSQSSIL